MTPLDWAMAFVLAVYGVILIALLAAFLWVVCIAVGWLRELARDARAGSEVQP